MRTIDLVTKQKGALALLVRLCLHETPAQLCCSTEITQYKTVGNFLHVVGTVLSFYMYRKLPTQAGRLLAKVLEHNTYKCRKH